MIDLDLLKGRALLGSPEALIASFTGVSAASLDYEYVIAQAQLRLHGRNEQELLAGFRHLKELLILGQGVDQGLLLDGIQAGKELMFQSDPITFLNLYKELDLLNQEDFPKAEPVEYFALLALIYAMQSMDYASKGQTASEDNTAELGFISADAHTRIAVAALADAQQMIAFIAGIEFAAIFPSKRAAKAVRSRHNKFTALKAEIFRFVDQECADLSNRKASRVVYAKLREKVDAISQSEEPEVSIEKWIGAYRNSQKARG